MPNLLAFLSGHYSAIPQTVWQQRLALGKVCNAQGEPYPVNAPYPLGQTVYYFRELLQEPRLPYQETILYQDDSLVVADKPHFLPVIPSGQYIQETLLVRLKQRLNNPHLVPLHRIDRDTAGVVLFGVNPAQRGAYQNLFRDTQISKQYIAIARYDAAIAKELAQYQANQQDYVISQYLQNAPHFMQMQVGAGRANANANANAHTVIVNIEPLSSPSIANHNNHNLDGLARYTLAPLTGKRHQLRVLMHTLGVPIIGDAIYPTLLPERDISDGSIERHTPLQLLAHNIAFIDPITGQSRYFETKQTLIINN